MVIMFRHDFVLGVGTGKPHVPPPVNGKAPPKSCSAGTSIIQLWLAATHTPTSHISRLLTTSCPRKNTYEFGRRGLGVHVTPDNILLPWGCYEKTPEP